MGQLIDSHGKPISFGDISGKPQEVFNCSVCKARTQHNLTQNSATYKQRVNLSKTAKPFEVEFTRAHYIYRCCSCLCDTYFLVQLQHTCKLSAAGTSQNVTLPQTVVHRHPKYIPEDHEAAPKSIRGNLKEAEVCLAAGAPNAAGTMARRAIDEIVRLHKGTGKDLYARLESLRTNSLISSELIDIAHKIRSAGRNGAHAEWEELSTEQARNVLFLLKEIIREIYITPAERKQRLKNMGALKKKKA